MKTEHTIKKTQNEKARTNTSCNTDVQTLWRLTETKQKSKYIHTDIHNQLNTRRKKDKHNKQDEYIHTKCTHINIKVKYIKKK